MSNRLSANTPFIHRDIHTMKRLGERILESQIDVFCEWGRRYNILSHYRTREWLELFALHSTKTDILDVNDDDIDEYLKVIYSKYQNQIWRADARTSITLMRRYYAARTKNGLAKIGRGRPPHISQIEQAQKYRKMGLKYHDISKLMNRGVSLIHRWVKYPLPKVGE